MRENYSKIQINTLTDKANFVLHGAAYCALCSGLNYFGYSQTVTLSALAGAVIVSLSHIDKVNDMVQGELPSTPHADLPMGSNQLPEVVLNISKELGVSPPPPLYVPDEEPGFGRYRFFAQRTDGEDDFKSHLKQSLQKRFGNEANAAAYGLNQYGLIITRELLKVLNSKEEAAVISHELGHIAANHGQKDRAFSELQTVTKIVGTVNLGAAIVSSLAGIQAFFLSRVVSGATGLLLDRGLHNSPANEIRVAVINKISGLAATGALLGAAYLEKKPEIMAAWALEKTMTTAARFVGAHYERCNEFQADRIAAEVTRDPQSLATGLFKIKGYNAALDSKDSRVGHGNGPLVLRPLKWARTVFEDHPVLKRRTARLARIARRLEKSSAPA